MNLARKESVVDRWLLMPNSQISPPTYDGDHIFVLQNHLSLTTQRSHVVAHYKHRVYAMNGFFQSHVLMSGADQALQIAI